jgi:hypothetical protein
VNKTANLFLTIAIALTVAVYAKTLRYQFVYDDTDQIVNNIAVHSWTFVPHYFTSDAWTHLKPNQFTNYYRPVFQLWLLLNYKLGGLNPVWWHFTSLLMHLVVTTLVFFLALIFARDEFVAGGAAILFGLHPVHVESVTWVSGITEPLMAGFFLGAFLCYLKSRQQAFTKSSRSLWQIMSLALFVAGLFEKETAVVLPGVIFCYRWFFPSDINEEKNDQAPKTLLQRSLTAVQSALPYLVLIGVYLIVRTYALHGLGRSLVRVPLRVLIYTWPSVLLFYVKSLIVPIGLSAFYDTPYVLSPSALQFFVPALVFLLIGLMLFHWSKRSSVVAFFSLWMILPLLPLLNLSVFKDAEIAHDRYLYLPSVGFCILLAYAIRHVDFGSKRVFGQPLAQLSLLLGCATLLGISTVYHSGFWTSNLSLYSRGVLIAPLNNIAATDYGTEVASHGNYEDAIPILHEVLRRKPNYWLPNFNLGFMYYQNGNLPEAERYLRQAIKVDPSDPDEYRFLGFTLLELGKADEAASVLEKAIALDPNKPDQHYALGTIHKDKQDYGKALNEFRLEQSVNPTRPDLQHEIADTEARLKNTND